MGPRPHHPRVLLIEYGYFAGCLALGEPGSAAEAFAKGSAMEILLANRRLGRRLARTGVRVVGAPADRLAVETLDAYLGLFAARRARGPRGRDGARPS